MSPLPFQITPADSIHITHTLHMSICKPLYSCKLLYLSGACNCCVTNSDSNKVLVILVSNNLNFTAHLNRIVSIAHSLDNFILCAFPTSNSSTYCKLFCSYVRSLLEYCTQIVMVILYIRKNRSSCIYSQVYNVLSLVVCLDFHLYFILID